MHAVQFKSFGSPTEVAECVELADPGPLAADQALLAVEATPINPSDVLTLTGQYGTLPRLPATPGNEGVGRVLAVGSDVKNVRVGDVVLLPVGTGTWREKIAAPAARLIPLPTSADKLQLAMLAINPPTAYLLLRDVVELKPGDWVVQNAANSGVGSYLIALAKLRGIRTVNVVRRESLVEPLRAAGADAVVVDGDDLAKRVAQATAKAPIRLAIDAIGGESTMRLAQCVAPGGTIANYGALSGQACRVAPQDLIFRQVTLRGFWLTKWFTSATPADQQAVFGELVKLMVDGTLRTRIEATYPFAKIKEALAHAMRPGRDGKILLVAAT
ncbi:MAG: zinc-dependent alcohol dehydrogenase family protein [Planctomycetia bacterium]|nr:zinc-dependent alcohol dehydrogenase family protein [Planctomycetia bacterium]